MSDKVVALMSVDLLKQQAKWKETLLELRETFASLQGLAYNESSHCRALNPRFGPTSQ
jgi:hypothetical protein